MSKESEKSEGVEKPFRKAGFQNDKHTLYMKEMASQVKKGKKFVWEPPQPGQTFTTRLGPFLVEELLEVFVLKNSKRYAFVSGKLIKRR